MCLILWLESVKHMFRKFLKSDVFSAHPWQKGKGKDLEQNLANMKLFYSTTTSHNYGCTILHIFINLNIPNKMHSLAPPKYAVIAFLN